MFKKLLKHDIRSVGRFWWILGAALFFTMLATGLIFRIGIETMLYATNTALEYNPAFILVVLIMMFAMMGSYFGFIIMLAIAGIGTEILVYWRFYKNLYTDEGYLTFTLPVSRKQILRSKTINAMIWLTLLGVIAAVGIFIIMLIVPPVEDSGYILINPVIIKGVFTALSEIWDAIGGWLIVYVLLSIPLFLLSVFCTVSFTQFCITVGSVIVKKLKLLVGIGIYYVVYNLIGTVTYVGSWFAVLFLIDGIVDFFEAASVNVACLAVTIVMVMAGLMLASFGAIFYFATRNLIERKLNLA